MKTQFSFAHFFGEELKIFSTSKVFPRKYTEGYRRGRRFGLFPGCFLIPFDFWYFDMASSELYLSIISILLKTFKYAGICIRWQPN